MFAPCGCSLFCLEACAMVRLRAGTAIGCADVSSETSVTRSLPLPYFAPELSHLPPLRGCTSLSPPARHFVPSRQKNEREIGMQTSTADGFFARMRTRRQLSRLMGERVVHAGLELIVF